jgi:diguanylate cyclase (GGDEF)-like protein
MILVGTLVISSLDAQYAARTQKLAECLHNANQQLRHVALYDALTGLPNRLLLQDRLEQAMSRAARSGKVFALMFVDLDRLKPVNDTYGHRVGDHLLQQTAARLQSAVRKEDTVARTGGDEFVVVLSELSSAEDAATLGRKLVAELDRPFNIESHSLSVTGSVGIAMYPDDASDIPSLLANADAAMYQVKKGGRNGVRFFGDGMVPVPSAQ